MEFRDVIARRRMVRNYDPDRPIPPEVRERLLEAAIHAPSAGFSQGWAFLVLESPAERDRLWALADAEPPYATISNAPLLIVPLSHKQAYLDRYSEPDKAGAGMSDEAGWAVPYWHIDTGMASLLILLTAVDEGLGAGFYGPPPDVDAFRAAFGVPGEFTPIGLIAVGYRAPDRRSPSLARGRRPRSEVVHRGSW